MKPNEPSPEFFRFSDPRQERIYRRLLLIGPGPASFYRDACKIMSAQPPFDTTTHLISHLFREIESALRDVLESVTDRSVRLSKQGLAEDEKHKVEIYTILKALDISETNPVAQAWLRLTGEDGLATRAHRNALAQPRPIDQKFQEFFGDMEDIINYVLERFESHYLESHRLLDELLAKTSPTKEGVQILRNKVPNNPVALGYFFGKLASPAWLEPLRDEGFFKNPPQPERDNENRTVSFPFWPQSQYLARMAALVPKMVLEIALQIPDTESIQVHQDLVDAALAMPPELAAKLVPKAKVWVNSPYQSLLPEKLGTLVPHLARGGLVDDAIDLAYALLAMSPDPRMAEKAVEGENHSLPLEPQAHFDIWRYEQILQKIMPDLVIAAGERALKLFCDLLDEAISISQSRKEHEGPEDHSWIWRPAIEDHSQNHLNEPKTLLVLAVRDTAELLVTKNIVAVSSLVRTFEQRRWRIFHRLALYLLSRFPEAAPELVAERLTDRIRFEEPGLRHEYALLARSCFSQLTPENQTKILGWIAEGPDLARFEAVQVQQTDQPSTDRQAERESKLWKRDRLALLGDNLPEEWQKYYRQLVAELGESKHPDFLTWQSEVWIGPTSPKTAEDLRRMSVEEIVSFLRAWQPTGGFMSPSPEGLGRQLTALIASDPERFAMEAWRFQELDPTYVRALISGLREAVKQKRAFPWLQVLDICHWVINQPREIPTRRGGDLDFDPDWIWTRKAIADLLSVGFETGAAEIPFNLRNEVWELLRPLTDDPDPTPEDEARHGGSSMDPATLSINTTRGIAMHAIVLYALWVRRHIEERTDGKERVARGFDEMPEALNALDRHLDPSYDPALAIRAVYGQWFPWLVLLDPNWAINSVTRIFSTEEKLRNLHDVAWETYMIFCPPYDNVFEVLRKEYDRAVENIGTASSERRRLADPDARLIVHLMTLYWRGKLNLEEPNGLLARFFAKASDDLRGRALEFIGRSLHNTKDTVEPKILYRLQALWERRIDEAHRAEAPTWHAAELTAFGWWFVSAKFNDVWAIAQLKEVLKITGNVEPDHLVLERLATLATSMPMPVVECLGLMVEGDKKGWRIRVWGEHVRAILAATLQSANEKARKAAVVLVNRLGARGYLEFQELLSRR